MKYKIDSQVRGVRIISGDEAKERRSVLNQLINLAEAAGCQEIILPSLEPAKIYADKAGTEVLDQMYVLKDKKSRELCLRPEGTATVQLLADKHLSRNKDVKFWYFERCWRYEKPQEGRYREFFQFGVEVINPSSDKVKEELIALAEAMVRVKTSEFDTVASVKRGLQYYTEDGFEISANKLGSQKQIVGGGAYRQGIGFGIGFDRLMLC
ncbi:histidyl-tRNA synthetase [Sinobacterium caligoides]|uniref:Histidine--tRNA ligase n=1 Tax=Sinobacterium caligoides TaxID=933926 RepID=A0A3N2DDU5_9GAMM|nr:ATP phosphoribosyltransferase regulatory subunit [Sinobacterium caligoides]ROR97970.1 histidyl-tRNA synthetase [Sinobacterium caligoides]